MNLIEKPFIFVILENGQREALIFRSAWEHLRYGWNWQIFWKMRSGSKCWRITADSIIFQRQQQLEESGGLIGERSFSLPFMAAAMVDGARHRKDPVLAKRTWQYMLHAMIHERNHEGFDYVVLQDQGNQKELKEIPCISTNLWHNGV